MEQTNLCDIKPRKTRADQILQGFIKYHRENPKVWELFKRFTFEVINAGFQNYSAWAIAQRIRWHTAIETTGKEVKLSNNFIAYYSRLFHAAYERHNGFFRIKKLTTQERPASDQDVEYFPSREPEGEDALMVQLEKLLNET